MSKIDKHLPVGQFIAQLRKARQWSMAELGRRVDASRNHIYDIEMGHSRPSYGLLEKILGEFGYKITFCRIPRPKPVKKRIKRKKGKSGKAK